MISRRFFLGGLLAAPAVIKTPGLLMPIKPPVQLYPFTEVLSAPIPISESIYEELHRITQRAFVERVTLQLYETTPFKEYYVCDLSYTKPLSS